ncbi:MAG: helix-turn-helix domain-containing protein [Spirochaetales bacterium]|nr:helix-turn-helix domain-containing protein [Candidatus Physcosoma equi]
MSESFKDKYMLTIREAAEYFGIGIKKMRRLAEDHTDTFAVMCGNRYLVIRKRFEEFLDNTSSI